MRSAGVMEAVKRLRWYLALSLCFSLFLLLVPQQNKLSHMIRNLVRVVVHSFHVILYIIVINIDWLYWSLLFVPFYAFYICIGEKLHMLKSYVKILQQDVNGKTKFIEWQSKALTQLDSRLTDMKTEMELLRRSNENFRREEESWRRSRELLKRRIRDQQKLLCQEQPILRSEVVNTVRQEILTVVKKNKSDSNINPKKVYKTYISIDYEIVYDQTHVEQTAQTKTQTSLPSIPIDSKKGTSAEWERARLRLLERSKKLMRNRLYDPNNNKFDGRSPKLPKATACLSTVCESENEENLSKLSRRKPINRSKLQSSVPKTNSESAVRSALASEPLHQSRSTEPINKSFNDPNVAGYEMEEFGDSTVKSYTEVYKRKVHVPTGGSGPRITIEAQIMVLTTLLLVVGVSLVLLLLWARYKSFCADLARWIMSNTEEKVVLTRLKGHYNANGYLVSSDSDIKMDWGTGSFRRFESVDSESALEIPPQPLRPAPTTTPPPKPIPVDEVCVEMPEGGPMLKRAVSCESVSSDSSVAAVDLVEPNVTGYLCIGIEYDSECGDLVVSVIEAKDLICKDYVSHNGLLDTFVTVYLLPTRTTDMQTRTYRSSRSPSYKEKFLFGLEVTDFCRSSLMFHVYSVRREENVLLGEAQLLLADVPTKQPITTWLTLLHSNMRDNSLGEILFSLSYLPTAERLTVVIVKARNLQFAGPSGDPYVKVYLLRNGKKVHKKKTQSKRNETCPIFNEAMIFSVPNNALQGLEVRVTVADSSGVIGHVIIGGAAAGKALSHWTQMLASLRKPIAMWHPLLQPQHLP